MLIYSVHYEPSTGEIVEDVTFKVDNDISRADLWAFAADAVAVRPRAIDGMIRITFVCNPDACLDLRPKVT